MKPILFTPPMVRGILDGRKTQTRRVINPQPYFLAGCSGDPRDSMRWRFSERADWPTPEQSPYRSGGILWVRETWGGDIIDGYAYRATDPLMDGAPWRPSIFMPRSIARLFLEVVSVRVQRVQEISEEDSLAENSFLTRCLCRDMQAKPKDTFSRILRQTACHIHGTEFRELWNSINAKRGFGWDVNPWVWAVEFKRIEKDEAMAKDAAAERGE